MTDIYQAGLSHPEIIISSCLVFTHFKRHFSGTVIIFMDTFEFPDISRTFKDKGDFPGHVGILVILLREMNRNKTLNCLWNVMYTGTAETGYFVHKFRKIPPENSPQNAFFLLSYLEATAIYSTEYRKQIEVTVFLFIQLLVRQAFFINPAYINKIFFHLFFHLFFSSIQLLFRKASFHHSSRAVNV